MRKISLNGEWKLYFFPEGKEEKKSPEYLNELKFISAMVPGNVELDLMKADMLSQDLYFAENIKTLSNYELYEW